MSVLLHASYLVISCSTGAQLLSKTGDLRGQCAAVLCRRRKKRSTAAEEMGPRGIQIMIRPILQHGPDCAKVAIPLQPWNDLNFRQGTASSFAEWVCRDLTPEFEN